jgi:hypothetical protein
MAARGNNNIQLDSIAKLAAEVAQAARVRSEQDALTLGEHTKMLGDIRETLARIDGRTEAYGQNFMRLEKKSETQQAQIELQGEDISRIKGFGAAVAFLLTAGEAAIAIFKGK